MKSSKSRSKYARYVWGTVCFGLFFAIIGFGLQDFGVLQYAGQNAGVGQNLSGSPDQRVSEHNVPNLKLQTIQGERFSLLSPITYIASDDASGNSGNSGSSAEAVPIILNFWASWCPPCVKEFPLLISKVLENPGEVALVAISIDQSRGDMERFLENFPLAQEHPDLIKVVWDPKSFIAQDKFNVIFMPETFIISRKGKIVSKIRGEVLEKDLAIVDELLQ